jgi:hypothetical protein
LLRLRVPESRQVKTEQVNIRLPVDLVAWLDSCWGRMPKVEARAGRSGHRSRVIEALLLREREAWEQASGQRLAHPVAGDAQPLSDHAL